MIGLVFAIALGFISLVLNGVIFLLTRFDVTNSILVSGLIQLLCMHQKWSTGMRWAIFIGILLLCLIVQHTFRVARILFSIFSVLLAGLLGYVGITYDSSQTRLLVTFVAMAVVIFLNYASWGIIKTNAGV